MIFLKEQIGFNIEHFIKTMDQLWFSLILSSCLLQRFIIKPLCSEQPFSVFRNFEATGFGFTIAKIEIWNDTSKPGIILNSSIALEIVTEQYFLEFLSKINILIGLKSYENQILRTHQLMQSIQNVISPILERFVDI